MCREDRRVVGQPEFDQVALPGAFPPQGQEPSGVNDQRTTANRDVANRQPGSGKLYWGQPYSAPTFPRRLAILPKPSFLERSRKP